MQTQEVAIKSSVKVVMKSDTEMLDEVMVVAFGTAKKSAFTGSAKVVGTEKAGAVASDECYRCFGRCCAGCDIDFQ